MSCQTITLRLVKSLKCTGREYTVWDDALKGFGIRVRASGAMTYVVVYRAGSGRGAPVRRYTIAAVGKLAPEAARGRAKSILGSVAHGSDPAADKTLERITPTVAELADQFLAEHVAVKRKAGTLAFYRDILDRIIKPEIGATKADKLTRSQVSRLHGSLAKTPFQANRTLAVVGSMYGYGVRVALVPEGVNPVKRIEKFRESRRERFLTTAELLRLGNSIREAESIGIPWNVDQSKETAKHAQKAATTKINPIAAAALRLLLFTGCRLGEILTLRWEFVDFERKLLLLPDSKSGRKTVVLNAPAMFVLANLPKLGPFAIPGDDPSKARTNLKRPWKAVTQHAGLVGLRLHDLRHTYASYGAGAGLGLPIIGKLLGHKHVSTTARYAHLDSDPLKQASEAIGGRIAAAFDGNRAAPLVKFATSLKRRPSAS